MAEVWVRVLIMFMVTTKGGVIPSPAVGVLVHPVPKKIIDNNINAENIVPLRGFLMSYKKMSRT